MNHSRRPPSTAVDRTQVPCCRNFRSLCLDRRPLCRYHLCQSLFFSRCQAIVARTRQVVIGICISRSANVTAFRAPQSIIGFIHHLYHEGLARTAVRAPDRIADSPIRVLFHRMKDVVVHPFLEHVDVGTGSISGILIARGKFPAVYTTEDAVVKKGIARHAFLAMSVDLETSVKNFHTLSWVQTSSCVSLANPTYGPQISRVNGMTLCSGMRIAYFSLRFIQQAPF